MAQADVFDVGYPVYYGRKIDEFTSDLVLGMVIKVHKTPTGELYDIELSDNNKTKVYQVANELCSNPCGRLAIWTSLKHLNAAEKTKLVKAMKVQFDQAIKHFMTDEPEGAEGHE